VRQGTRAREARSDGDPNLVWRRDEGPPRQALHSKVTRRRETHGGRPKERRGMPLR
jgi:hypothetical protein